MKSFVRWLLFEYKGLERVILSKPFKTKELTKKARLKYPERARRQIGIGVVRVDRAAEIGVIEDIEEIGARLKSKPLGEAELAA